MKPVSCRHDGKERSTQTLEVPGGLSGKSLLTKLSGKRDMRCDYANISPLI